MEQYTYKILSVDTVNHTMIVEYTPTNANLTTIAYNINAPLLNEDIAEYVNRWAPQEVWSKQLNPNPNLEALIGTSGKIDVVAPDAGSDVVNNIDEYTDYMKKLQDEFEQENA